MKSALICAAVICAALLPTHARAQDATEPATAGLAEDREVPDYDGRPDEGPDAGEVLLWIPRIVFGPLTLLLDYGIRRPLGFLVETAERESWDVFVLDLVTWNERRSGLIPTFFVGFGLQPSVGLSFWSNDEIANGHQVRLSASFGGVDYLQASGAYRIVGHGGAARIGLRAGVGRRPDRVFSGIGWDASSTQYRFRESSYRASVASRLQFWRESTLSLEAGVDGHEFGADGYAALAPSPDSRSLADGIASNELETPPGLEGYVAYRQRAELAVDTREPEPAPGHGLRAEGFVELAFDLRRPIERRWLRYGGAVGAFVDVGHHRVFGLWALAHFADPLGPEPVPFTELIEFGDQHLQMQGFLQGQLRGRSGVAATLEYRYPIWTRFDGRLHVSVGNVFGERLSDFAFERLRASFGLGLSTTGDPDNALSFGVAAGTSAFVDGFAIESVQALFGTRQGF